MREIKIAPSLLAADAARLAEETERVERAGADWLHLDIMDAHFVPNLSYSASTVKALRPLSRLVFDVHLMITDPEKYLDSFVDAGADIITVHYEAINDENRLRNIAEKIHKKGLKAGISIKPKTMIDTVEAVLDAFDMILIMTVEPGFGGQSYMEDMNSKITRAASLADTFYPNLDIEVDGGIAEKTIQSAASAGANIFVAGSSVFGADDARAEIAKLREIAEKTRKPIVEV